MFLILKSQDSGKEGVLCHKLVISAKESTRSLKQTRLLLFYKNDRKFSWSAFIHSETVASQWGTTLMIYDITVVVCCGPNYYVCVVLLLLLIPWVTDIGLEMHAEEFFWQKHGALLRTWICVLDSPHGFDWDPEERPKVTKGARRVEDCLSAVV